MACFRQGRDGDIRNVIGIDEGFPDIADRQRDIARQDKRQEFTLREILVGPAGPNDGPVHAALLDDAFAGLGVRLPPA